jgi:radical SAM superfamily enzyme YgiQ (UPF0313 family)
MSITSNGRVRATLLSLYSHQYPAIGEAHGLSPVAGSLQAAFPADQIQMTVLDMVQWGEESCSRAVDIIRQTHANILAIGLHYGTYSVFRREYAGLRAALDAESSLLVIGGPLATYLSESLLRDVAPEAIIILGEAEHALPALIRSWLGNCDISGIPNLHYLDPATGREVRTHRRLANMTQLAQPYREHISAIHKIGGEIFEGYSQDHHL